MDASARKKWIVVSCIALLPAQGFSLGGARHPEPPATQPNNPPKESPRDDANDIVISVDKYFRDDQLQITRDPASQAEPSDSCDSALQGRNRFGERLAHFIERQMSPRVPKLGGINSIYGVRGSEADFLPVSLESHPMCNVTSSTLQATLAGIRVPPQRTIDLANDFANRYNDLRTRSRNGDASARAGLSGLWTRFMGCLAYIESLTTADTARSEQIARSTATPNYHRPPGVLFYIDNLQEIEDSRLNIGMFQFSPVSGGNIRPCIDQWNATYPSPSCRINPKGGRAEMIHALGSSLQDFNNFCGVDKLLQTFHIQVNTSATDRTHPSNRSKAPKDRCVSLHFQSGRAYVHFGPFMNSIGNNLESLLSCTLERS